MSKITVRLIILVIAIMLTGNLAIAASKNKSAPNKTATKQSNIEFKGFSDINFDDGVLQIVANLRKMGVKSIILNDNEAINMSNEDIIKVIFNNNGVFNEGEKSRVELVSFNSAIDYLKESYQYEINNKKYFAFNSSVKISASPISINSVPYKLIIGSDNSRGYPLLHFDNALKYAVKLDNGEMFNIILASRIRSLTLRPLATLPPTECKAIAQLYENKYHNAKTLNGSGSYKDKDGNRIEVEYNGAITYENYRNTIEDAEYRKHELQRTKKSVGNTKDSSAGI